MAGCVRDRSFHLVRHGGIVYVSVPEFAKIAQSSSYRRSLRGACHGSSIMRLCLVISALERGGAERVLSVLANAWTEKGHDVTLITFDNSESPAYPLHPGVVLKSLGVPNKPAGNSVRAITRNLQRIFRLRRSIRESAPEIVLSFLDFSNIITLLATRRMAVPVIVSERANPAFDDLKSLWRTLRRRLYPRAAALVCQTNTIVSQRSE